MILQVENRSPRPCDGAEAERRHLSLLACLQRMGFHDPAALIAACNAERPSLRESQFVEPGSESRCDPSRSGR